MEDEYFIQLQVSGNATLGNRSTLRLIILMENINEGTYYTKLFHVSKLVCVMKRCIYVRTYHFE